MATHEITLNLKKTNIAPPVITVHQGDSAEVLKAAIYDGDKKAALTGCKCTSGPRSPTTPTWSSSSRASATTWPP